jgi:diguanylate cyclase (GGDEF)-like protein
LESFIQTHIEQDDEDGDKVQRITARMIQKELRAFDFCGHYGGEEFVLMVGQTASIGARAWAERIRKKVESLS